jgi:UDP-N-acetylmuramate--alanine ligase
LAESTKKTLDELDLSKVHLLGIGGAGQNALADILLDMGYTLTGSDLKLSDTTQALAQRGVTIYEGHRAENLDAATLVVTTAAANASNVEIAEAHRRNIPVLSNAEMTGKVMNRHETLLAVAGTHGKTTTTGLVAYLLKELGLDPTWYIGGVPRDLGKAGHARDPESDTNIAVVEADEYAERFLNYEPSEALITNIEADHLDYYGSYEGLEKAFSRFVGNIRSGGRLFICNDDPGARSMFKYHKPGIHIETYGTSADSYFWAKDLEPNKRGGFDFKINSHGTLLGKVSLQLAGVHNVRNALGAIALAWEGSNGVPIEELCRVAGNYTGTARRFELKGEVNGVTVVDDYAHHPTEIRATLAAARARYGNRRLVALFQPHTYTRTKALLNEFADAFDDADVVAIMEIFPARETDTLGVSSTDILGKMQHTGKLSEPLTHANAVSVLNEIFQDGDVLLTLGAGDVWKVGEELLER